MPACTVRVCVCVYVRDYEIVVSYTAAATLYAINLCNIGIVGNVMPMTWPPHHILHT